jgi:hypothetical protein
MTKSEIEKAMASDQPLYWQEVTVERNRWHQVKVVDYDATKRRWRIQTPIGIRLVRSGALFPQIVEFGNHTSSEVFLGAGGFVYTSGVASAQRFQKPLIELWHQVYKGKRPISVQQGSTLWKRDALLVMARACGQKERLDRPEEYGLPADATYADLAANIDERLRNRTKHGKGVVS